MNKYILILFCTILLFSCKKDKPPVGDYIGIFQGEYNYQGNYFDTFRSHKMLIQKSTDKELVIECGGRESKLCKDKKVVMGTIITDKYVGTGHNEFNGPIVICGNWRKESGKYFISGSYQSTYTSYNSLDSSPFTVPVNGTFEIKSDF